MPTSIRFCESLELVALPLVLSERNADSYGAATVASSVAKPRDVGLRREDVGRGVKSVKHGAGLGVSRHGTERTKTRQWKIDLGFPVELKQK